jgi:hypothetical protein
MRIRKIIPLLIVVALAVTAVWSLLEPQDRPSGNDEIPNDWFFNQRAYPVGKINYDVYVSSLKQTMAIKSAVKEETYWTFAGPYNTGGRFTDVESRDCTSDIYLGAASGGIFRVNNEGTSWESIFDDALSPSIGDIAIAPSDCSVIYVGTGEANGGGGSQTYDGVGIYKSTDGGDTWEYKGLEESRNVGRIAVHPENPDIAYVAAMGSLFADTPDRGIYRTMDGGETWENMLYVSDSTGGIDVVIHPTSPNVVYAALWERVRRPDRRSYGGPSCGIFRSENDGITWTELTNGLPSPGNDIGRIGIDIAESTPNVLYAIYADKTGYFEGVYKTFDGGDTWIPTNDAALNYCYQSYGWWFGRIEVDPTDPDIAFVIGFDLYRTTTGGNAWTNVSEDVVHVDQHGLYIDPQDNSRVFLGNDGGYYVSDDGGTNWEWINTLPITQFYTCEIDEQVPERLYGGTQDNGTNRTLTGSTDDWERIYGGDGFYVLVNPENNNFIYAEYQYGGLGRSTNGGTSFSGATNGISSSDRKNWNTPVVFDPSNPATLYYGAKRLYKTTNLAVSCTPISPDLTNGPGVNLTYGTITTISVSPVNTEILYIGTDDGNVWIHEEGTWEILSGSLPDRWVTRVVADPWDEATVYVTFSGYRWDEYLPHIFRSEDKGQNWEDISQGLPEIPLNDVIIDPEDNQTLYVASDAGVFVSHDKGEQWGILGSNLPLVPVNDLDLHNETRTLVAATFGRSMYRYDLFQDTLTTQIGEALSKVQSPLNIHVFPNPVHAFSKIQIVSPMATRGEITLLNMNGKNLSTKELTNIHPGMTEFQLGDLNASNLKAGIYYLSVQTELGRVTEKIIVSQDLRSSAY